MRHGMSRSTGNFLCALCAALLAAAAALLVPGNARAQEDGEDVSIGHYRMLHSAVLDEDRLLLVALPKGYDESDRSYPVLYLLYGGQVRGYFAEAVNIVDRLSEAGEIPQMIVAGVANVERYRDLRPIGERSVPGAVDRFIEFFSGELVPFVDKEYRTKDYRILIGPQAGGSFGYYALTGGLDLFDAYILENPFKGRETSEYFFERSAGMLERGFPSYVFMQISVFDREGPQYFPDAFNYPGIFEKMVNERKSDNFDLVMRYIEGNRDFIPEIGIKEGLRALFADYTFPEDRPAAKLTDLTSYYGALSDRLGFTVEVPELTLVLRASKLVEDGKLDEAQEMLEYLRDQVPTSLNAYWQLANLHRMRGENEIAIGYYRKCLELMPNMGPARRWLEELEK